MNFAFAKSRTETIQNGWFLSQKCSSGFAHHPTKSGDGVATHWPDLEKSRNQFRQISRLFSKSGEKTRFFYNSVRNHPKEMVSGAKCAQGDGISPLQNLWRPRHPVARYKKVAKSISRLFQKSGDFCLLGGFPHEGNPPSTQKMGLTFF